ncbi:MAG: HU family DNA-binding protein [Gammaproteobacteria bacterium]|nr:HU family DNA-binding protein [Gammaproteobacteria bacterium]MCY4283006.1 HU family DNA-binding protein [Gammaproteobacteria bacterium]
MSYKPQAIAQKQTKSQILTHIAEDTGLTKKQVGAVLDSMAALAVRHLQHGASGEFTVPSMGVKLNRVMKPARAARPGINPATGEKITIAAKPASVAVRAMPLKALKDSVS